MKLYKLRTNITYKNFVFLIIFLIIIMTCVFIDFFGEKVSTNMVKISEIVINDVITNSVNSNIKKDVLNKYNINDLIIINKSNDKIDNISYNLNSAYDMLIDIKSSLMKSIESVVFFDKYDAEFKNGKLCLKTPFYNYMDNLLLSNLGAKIESCISFLQTVSGNVITKVMDYGINSLKMDLYINFLVESVIIVPFKEEKLKNNYDLLISSKVIQGDIPSFYNGKFETSSGIINLN